MLCGVKLLKAHWSPTVLTEEQERTVYNDIALVKMCNNSNIHHPFRTSKPKAEHKCLLVLKHSDVARRKSQNI
jgi:hypothetical protein